MTLARYDIDEPLDGLRAETIAIVERWDWNRGAYGHALSLPARRQLHPHGRDSYENFPCAGLLDDAPALRRVFDGFACEKVSFRLLRRGPGSAYAWHTDTWKGPGVVRFQIPIVCDGSAELITTDYDHVGQIRGDTAARPGGEGLEGFVRANAGHAERHRLEPGRLHYFNTSRVHTLVNSGPSERVTLSFDLVANDWLLERYPEVAEEAGGATGERLARPGRLAAGAAFARSRSFGLRNRVRVALEQRRSR